MQNAMDENAEKSGGGQECILRFENCADVDTQAATTAGRGEKPKKADKGAENICLPCLTFTLKTPPHP